MLVNTSSTIAYKCHFCGNVEFFKTSIFGISATKEKKLYCKCKKSYISISGDVGSGYTIKVPCIGCGDTHIFIFNSKFLMSNKAKILYCPNTGIEQCIIGADEEVRLKMDLMEMKFDELISALGYDNYFKNTQVMFNMLNIIHDVAEEGNLYCECGNDDIEVILFSDKIYLRCKKCTAIKTILAGSNEDLRDILLKDHILIMN